MRDWGDRFVIVIAPGRFDDDPTQAREDAAAFADIIVGTEATAHPFNVPGWTVIQGSGREGETFIAVAPGRFTVVAEGIEQITSGGGKGRFAHPTFAPWCILRDHSTGYLLVVIGIHLRAHLWPSSKHWRPGNVTAWWQGIRGIQRLHHRLHGKYPRAALVVLGDPNATHWQFFVKAVRKLFPKAKPVRSGAFSSGLLRGLRVVRVETIDPGPGSDHDWKRVTVQFFGSFLVSTKPKEK